MRWTGSGRMGSAAADLYRVQPWMILDAQAREEIKESRSRENAFLRESPSRRCCGSTTLRESTSPIC